MEGFGIEAETSHVQRYHRSSSMNTSKISQAFRNSQKGRIEVAALSSDTQVQVAYSDGVET